MKGRSSILTAIAGLLVAAWWIAPTLAQQQDANSLTPPPAYTPPGKGAPPAEDTPAQREAIEKLKARAEQRVVR